APDRRGVAGELDEECRKEIHTPMSTQTSETARPCHPEHPAPCHPERTRVPACGRSQGSSRFGSDAWRTPSDAPVRGQILQSLRSLRMTVCCALSLFMALSCGRSESKSPTTKTSSSHVRIVYIPKNTGNPYFDPLIE